MKTLYKKLSPYAWVLIIIAFMPMLLKARVPDSDTYFLAATGRYIVNTGTIPDINPFVIHEGLGIVIQQWLFDVLIYWLFDSFGNVGLLVYTSIICAVTLTLLYYFTGLFTNNKFPRVTCVLLSAFLLVAFMVPRPVSFSIPCIIAELIFLEKYRQTRKVKWLLPLLGLSTLLINMHATMFVMLFVMMLPHVFPYVTHTHGIKEFIKSWWEEHKALLFVTIGMFFTGFLNPYGFNGMTYVLKSYGHVTNLTIQELLSPTLFSEWGVVALFGFTFFCFYCQKLVKKISSKENLRRDFTYFYMTAGTFFMYCQHLRNLWCFIISIIPVILMVWGDFAPPEFTTKEKSATKCGLIMMSLILVTGLILTAGFCATPWSKMTDGDQKYTPMLAADYLDTQDTSNMVLFTEFNNGAYLEWRGYKVFMDARPELFVKDLNGKEDILNVYSQMQQNKLGHRDFINQYQFTHLIVEDDTMFDVYLSCQPDFKCTVDGNGYNLYELINEGE